MLAIAESATLKVDSKAKALKAQGRPVISYAAGEPDFETPENIVEAALRAVSDPKNHRYTPAVGLPKCARQSQRRPSETPEPRSIPHRSWSPMAASRPYTQPSRLPSMMAMRFWFLPLLDYIP